MYDEQMNRINRRNPSYYDDRDRSIDMGDSIYRNRSINTYDNRRDSPFRYLYLVGIIGGFIGMLCLPFLLMHARDMPDDEGKILHERFTPHTISVVSNVAIYVSPGCNRLLAMPYNPAYGTPERLPNNASNPRVYRKITGYIDQSKTLGTIYALDTTPPAKMEITEAEVEDMERERTRNLIRDQLHDNTYIRSMYTHPIPAATVGSVEHFMNYSPTYAHDLGQDTGHETAMCAAQDPRTL